MAEVAAVLDGLPETDRLAVLLHHVCALATQSGQPALFLALAHQAGRERLGLEG